MDTFAHIALGILTGSRTGRAARPRPRWYADWTLWAAAGFGALPDLSSFGLYMAQRLFSGKFGVVKPELEELPRYVFVNYQLTHSLVIAAVVGVLIFFGWRKGFLPYLAWPLHILCDIPVHGKAYFATPFLWPLSDYRFDGWSFGEHKILILIYWALIFGFIAWRIRRDRKTTSVKAAQST